MIEIIVAESIQTVSISKHEMEKQNSIDPILRFQNTDVRIFIVETTVAQLSTTDLDHFDLHIRNGKKDGSTMKGNFLYPGRELT